MRRVGRQELEPEGEMHSIFRLKIAQGAVAIQDESILIIC